METANENGLREEGGAMTSSEQGQDILPYDCKNNYSMNELEI
jgi:hypothetical protein